VGVEGMMVKLNICETHSDWVVEVEVGIWGWDEPEKCVEVDELRWEWYQRIMEEHGQALAWADKLWQEVKERNKHEKGEEGANPRAGEVQLASTGETGA
jgi:hypothetical protein